MHKLGLPSGRNLKVIFKATLEEGKDRQGE